MKDFYKADLAFIHDVGFADYALKSARGILEILEQNQIRDGLVVDLGCGSGLWAQELRRANYQVLGIDISESLIAIARKRVPDAEFWVESLFKAEIPLCKAVTSVGECLNYRFDPDSDRQALVYQKIGSKAPSFQDGFSRFFVHDRIIYVECCNVNARL